MPHAPNQTGHRILEALDDGPLPYPELREIVGAPFKHFGSVLHAMKVAEMVEQIGNMVGMLDRGAEALADLRDGLDYEPRQTSVRVFSYQGRAA